MKKKELIILAVIIAVLTLALWAQKIGKGSDGSDALPAFKALAPEAIQRLIIVKGTADAVELTRSGSAWGIGSDAWSADMEQVNPMLEAVGELRITSLVSEAKQYDRYELDDAAVIRVRAYGDGEQPVREVSIGKVASTRRHTFVRLPQDERVWHASGDLRGIFDRTAEGLRDKRVMSVVDDVQRVTLDNGKRRYTFIKESSDEGTFWRTEDKKTAKADKVRAVVDTLRTLNADGFVTDRQKESLDTFLYRVTLETAAGTHSLSIVEKDGEQYIATSSDSPYVFVLSGWRVDRIMPDLNIILELQGM